MKLTRYNQEGIVSEEGTFVLYEDARLLEEEFNRREDYAQDLRETLRELHTMTLQYNTVCRELKGS
jgi:hypothetical protein